MTTEALTRRRFTVEEYHRMAEAGVLREDDRVELIEGEIADLSPIGKEHVVCVNRLNRFFSRRLGANALVSVQNPVRLGPHSEPQPDLALLRPRPDDYLEALAGPQDILLVVEVADTSQAYDRNVKIALYAQAGIPEAWLVDVATKTVEVYRKPGKQGYAETAVFRSDQRVASQAFPKGAVDLGELFRQIP